MSLFLAALAGFAAGMLAAYLIFARPVKRYSEQRERLRAKQDADFQRREDELRRALRAHLGAPRGRRA